MWCCIGCVLSWVGGDGDGWLPLRRGLRTKKGALGQHLPSKAPTTKITHTKREGTSSMVLSDLSLKVGEEVTTGALPNPSSQPECQDNTKATRDAVFIFWI